MDLLQRWKQVFGVFCGHSQASRQICGQRSPCAGSSALWRMYSNVWPNLTRREVVLQGTKKVRHTHTHSRYQLQEKKTSAGQTSYVFLARRGSLHSWWGWSVGTPEAPPWSSSSARAPLTAWPRTDFWSGRERKQTNACENPLPGTCWLSRNSPCEESLQIRNDGLPLWNPF